MAEQKGAPRNSTMTISFSATPKYKDKLLFIKSLETLFVYIDGKYYRPVDVFNLRRDIWDHVNTMFPTARLTDSLVTDIQKQIPCSVKALDKLNDHYLAFDDCLFDCETLSTTSFDPKKIATIYFPFKFSEIKDIETPVFSSFLNTVFVKKNNLEEPDQELISIIQQIFGYLLVPQMDACAAFFFVGEGSNGKSTITKLLERVFGDEYISSFSLETLTLRAFASAGLIGKRINICNEEESKYMRSDKFKAMISGDKISAERKFGNTFEFNPQTKFLFCTNQMPTFDGINYGLKRRIKIIPFHRIFSDAEQDKKMSIKMNAEIGGIIYWALQGLRTLVDNNYVFSYSSAMQESLDDFVSEISSPVMFFKECFQVDLESFVSNKDLYVVYSEWCKENNRKPFSSQKFHKELSKNLAVDSVVKWTPAGTLRGKNIKPLEENFDPMKKEIAIPF